MRLPTITDIERVSGSKRARRVWVDGEPFRTTSVAVVKSLGLHVGDTVDPKRLIAVWETAERAAARERVVGLLARHEYSVHQLRRRLADDGYAPAVIEDALARLQTSGLVDDARFAEALVTARLRAGYGRRAIRRDLARAGVADGLAEKTLREVSDAVGGIDATAAALRLARPADDVAKLASRLARRGFDVDEALAAARAVLGGGGPDGIDADGPLG